MATIRIIDPVTRIEGHMSVEVSIENGQVVDAKCTGTLFRGFETILTGRKPWDAPVLTQRICGVCPIAHGDASVRALDNAWGRTIPSNARILRNLTLGANFIQSHILHFYLLAALDYIKGPNTKPWTPAWNVDIRSNSSLNTVASHLTSAIEARRRAHEMGALFGGRMPSSHTYIPGGFTAVPNSSLISKYHSHLDWLLSFINNTYIPDVETVGSVYSDYFSVGAGPRNLLAYGVFDLNSSGSNKLLQRGYIENGAIGLPAQVNLDMITEAVTYSWYKNTTSKHPSAGTTEPTYPKNNAYSWLKAPRYSNKACEVGALARMWVNGDYQNGISVMDRHVARALETRKIAQAMQSWLNQLQIGGSVYDNDSSPSSGEGYGLTEAPRGALGHWVKISSDRISHYQVITPTCWNASPKDNNANYGPMEQALVGTTIENEDQPIEVLRIIHSFDPCLSCAVHIMRPNRKAKIIPVQTF